MVNPLTCILPLRPGTRPDALLTTLAALNGQTHRALEAVGTVHFARFVLLDPSSPDLRPRLDGTGGPFRLAVITEYDGSFETYIRAFAAYLPAVFGEILAATEDWSRSPDLSSEANVAAFVEYVRGHDLAQISPNKELSMYRAYTSPVTDVLNHR